MDADLPYARRATAFDLPLLAQALAREVIPAALATEYRACVADAARPADALLLAARDWYTDPRT